jgi:hypothetical protein
MITRVLQKRAGFKRKLHSEMGGVLSSIALSWIQGSFIVVLFNFYQDHIV